MRKDLTEVVFILDRSGSMHGLESDTIGGFNSLLEKQKKEEGEAYINTILFANNSMVLHDRKRIAEVEPITERDYVVGGCTALLDAMGGAIHHIANIHKYAREEDRPAKTLFVIITDGMENASRTYTFDKVKSMVEHEKEKYGWEFLFLGADIDAIKVARSVGVDASRAVNYEKDAQGTQTSYSTLCGAMSMARRSSSSDEMREVFGSSDILGAIRKDHAERSKK